MRGYLLRVTGELATADDLSQEAYLRFLGADTMRDASAEHRRRFLFHVATNLLRDRFRRSRHWEEVDDGMLAVAPEIETGSIVRQALHRLSARERALLWLAYVEQLSHREIATMLGIREASVRPMLYRAKGHLAGILEVVR